MGAYSSSSVTDRALCTSRDVVLSCIKSPIPRYVLAREVVNIKFCPSDVLRFTPSVPSVHSPETMVNMIINCHDQISNYPALIEAIIATLTDKDESIIAILNTEFKDYQKLFAFRDSIFNAFNTFESRNFTPFTFLPLPRYRGPRLTFERLLQAFKSCYLMFKREKVNEADVKDIINFFDEAIPPSCLPPPLNDFCVRASPHQEFFEACQIKKHAICTNESFLFILADSRIYAFPITENGALNPPFYRTIDDKLFTDSVSMIANTHVIINDLGFCLSISVEDLIKGPIGTPIKASEKSVKAGFGFIVSDGVTSVHVDSFWKATPSVEGISQTEVQFHISPSVTMNHVFPVLLPPNGDSSTLPCVTNGNFIGFFYQINHVTYLLRVFSLATGAHVCDDVFNTPETIIAATIDIIHRCYYVVVPLNNNRLCVRRFHFLGSEDPGMLDLFSYTSGLGLTQRLMKKVVRAIVGPISSVIGSHIIPSSFIPQSISGFIELLDLLMSILTLPSETIKNFEKQIIATVQSIVTIIHSNVLFVRKATFDTTEIINKLFEIIRIIPPNLAVFLFFSNLDLFFNSNLDYSTAIMIGLYTRIKWRPLQPYVIRCLENSTALALIPFNKPSKLRDLISQSISPISNIPDEMITLLLIHQRVLVSAAAKILRKEPFADITFKNTSNFVRPSPLDNFGDYLQNIISEFDNAISKLNTPMELQDSLIFLLFDNFIRIVSCLIEFHSIARVTTALISVLLSKLSHFISTKIDNLDNYPIIANLILTLLFSYGKFASTLVKGGGLSEFESKCMWLMRANINLIDDPQAILNLDSSLIEEFSTPNLSNFLKGSYPGMLQTIYTKYKAPFHKNLSKEIQMLDRAIVAAVCKHTNTLDLLLQEDTSVSLSPQLKKAADQMIKVRNLYRSLTQNDKKTSAENIYLRSLMLLRMGSDFLPSDNHENLLSEFLMSEYSPEYVKNTIKQQRTRVQVTLVGFALIDKTYTMQIHPLLNDIIAYTLSCIESFEGLAVIMRITKLNEVQIEQMTQFFARILDMIETTHNDRLTLIALRFFRDIDSVKDIQRNFLSKVLSILSKDPKYYSMFALALSLIRVVEEIPEYLTQPSISSMEIIILSEILKLVKGDDIIFQNFAERYINCTNPLLIRILGRVMIQLFNSKRITSSLFSNFFQKLINIIGSAFVNFQRIELASEIIIILRLVINNNLEAKSVLLQTIKSITPESEETDIAFVFSTLTHFLEPMHAYCNARFHQDRNTSTEVIAVPTNQLNEYLIYQRPFSLMEKSNTVVVTPPAFIYAVPFYQIKQKAFGDFEYILSFFDSAVSNSKYSNITQSLFIQTVSHFLKDKDFLNMISQENVSKFCVSPIPFGNITDTLQSAISFNEKPKIPQFNGFNTLVFVHFPTITYLSPQIKPDAKFHVTIHTTADRLRGCIGVVSDTVDGFYARYALAELPSGTFLPAYDKMRKLKPSQKYTMEVDMKSHIFSIGINKYEFPLGSAFRVIITVEKDLPLEINCNSDYFDPTAFSPIVEHAAMDFEYKGNLYQEPSWVSTIVNIPESVATLPRLNIDVAPVSYKERLKRNFVVPKNYVLIHPKFATQASQEICNEVFRGLFRQISCQWMTIALVRIASSKPELITDEKVIVKLFSILSVLLEQFFPNQFLRGQFPFSLEEPIWNSRATTNLLYLSLDIESKNALCALSKRSGVSEAVGKCISAMVSDPYLHLIAYPNGSHKYFPPGEAGPTVNIRGPAIVTVNSFTGQLSGFFKIMENDFDSPGTVYKPSDIRVRIDPNAFALSVFYVSPMDNSWIFESPFEMLILLKSFIYMCTSNEARLLSKSAIIDSLVAASPFILPYIPQFLELLQVTVPSIPLDSKTPYRNKLILMASAIQQMSPRVQERMNIVFLHEQRVLVSSMAADLSAHFPEFFNSEISKPLSTKCKIPLAILDPGAITSDFMHHILMIRLFARKYTTLVGFPFWEILPLWYRVSGFYKGNNDYISPEFRFIQGNYLRFTNPSKIDVSIIIKPKYRLPADSIIIRSKTDTFEDSDYIMYSDIGIAYQTKEETLFYSLIAVPNGWSSFDCSFVLNESAPSSNRVKSIEIDVPQIHSQFIAEMEEFAIRWDDEDTDTLLNVLPRNALQLPTFSTVESIAKQSTLTMRYSASIVLLRALLIHHFNYLKMSHSKDVSTAIWENLTKFISCEDASDQFIRCIAKGDPKVFPEIIIDRHAARRLILDGVGDTSVCIVHQLSNVFKSTGPDALRCPARPWRVKFVGEEAIDAGGPARELMTECAASIFEKSSRLAYPVPNARHKIGQFLEFYVPYDSTGKRYDEFRAIGTYIGIVIRTGLVQDLPFVPFVWKFLSGGELNSNDVLQVDNALSEQFEHLKEAEVTGDLDRFAAPWNVEQWDGSIAMIPGHSAETYVQKGEVESFINESINFRINSLRPTLVAMKEGFIENIKVESHPLLTGSRLSHMAQGSSMITTQQLRSITIVQDFSGLDDIYIVRFFRAIDRLNPDQRKMLLKFITTLTRLPNSTINQGFNLKIDRLNREKPDESLPTASTCFNKLHLPCYSSDNICYQRLLTAIQYCQTMENR